MAQSLAASHQTGCINPSRWFCESVNVWMDEWMNSKTTTPSPACQPMFTHPFIHHQFTNSIRWSFHEDFHIIPRSSFVNGSSHLTHLSSSQSIAPIAPPESMKESHRYNNVMGMISHVRHLNVDKTNHVSHLQVKSIGSQSQLFMWNVSPHSIHAFSHC